MVAYLPGIAGQFDAFCLHRVTFPGHAMSLLVPVTPLPRIPLEFPRKTALTTSKILGNFIL